MAETTRVPATRRDFLISCLLVCCALLTIASFTFAMYTVKEFATLKARVSELEQSQSNIHLLIPKDDFSSKKSMMKSTANLNKDGSSSRKKRTIVDIVEPSTTGTKRKRRHGNKKRVSIHLAGSAGRMMLIGRRTGNTVKNWKVVHSTGNITYNEQTGEIVVNIPGMYFIYNQLQMLTRHHSGPMFWKYATYINNKKVLESVLTTARAQSSQRLKTESNYQGGIFPLQKGDRLRIFIEFNGPWRIEENNYFGMFRLSH